MKPQIASALLLIKMAFKDGTLALGERALLEEVCVELGEPDLENLISQAKHFEIEYLVQLLPKYADRFMVSLRAFLMATIDHDFDKEEQKFLGELLDHFQIPPNDRLLLQEIERSLRKGLPIKDPRMKTLFIDSCFNPARA